VNIDSGLPNPFFGVNDEKLNNGPMIDDKETTIIAKGNIYSQNNYIDI